MKKPIKSSLILFLLSLPLLCLSQPKVNASISDVDFAFNGTDVEITYSLVSAKAADKFNISVLIYKKSDSLVAAKTFWGDTGKAVTPGQAKKIYWNPKADGLTLNTDVFVEIKAAPVFRIPLELHLLKSAILPGLGNYRLGNGSMYALYGAAAYGSVAASLIFNSKAANTYGDYKNTFDIDKSNELYKKSVQQKNISLAFACVAAAIWATDFFSLVNKTHKLRYQGVNNYNSAYYYEKSIANISARSKVKMLDTRTPYDIAMIEGNKFYSEEDFISALKSFQKALTFKPGDETAAKIIAAINNPADWINEKTAKYNNSLKAGDSLFSKELYSKSLTEYNSALAIKEKVKANYPALIGNSDFLKNDSSLTAKLALTKAKVQEKIAQEKFGKINESSEKTLYEKEYEKAMASYKEALSKQIKDLPDLVIEDDEFIDAGGNYIIDGGEKSYITFKIRNNGKGVAQKVQVKCALIKTVAGLSVQNSDNAVDLKPDEAKDIILPVNADLDLPTGFADFKIEVTEERGLNALPLEIKIETNAFKQPDIIVTDAVFSTDNGGEIELNKKISLRANIQNIGNGGAKDVTAKISFPSESCFNLSGPDKFVIGKLAKGESSQIELQFTVTANNKLKAIPFKIALNESCEKFAHDTTIKLNISETLKAKSQVIIKGIKTKDADVIIESLTSDVDKNIPVSDSVNSNK